MGNAPDSFANELLSARRRRCCARLPFSHGQGFYRYARDCRRTPFNASTSENQMIYSPSTLTSTLPIPPNFLQTAANFLQSPATAY